MQTLKSIKAAYRRTEAHVRVLQRRRDALDAQIARLTGDAPAVRTATTATNASAKATYGVKRVVFKAQKRATPRVRLAEWLARRKLPDTVARLAAQANGAGYSGKPNTIAAVAHYDRLLRRLPDGRVALRIARAPKATNGRKASWTPKAGGKKS